MNYSCKALQDGQVSCQDLHSEGCYKTEIGMWRELMEKISKIISVKKKYPTTLDLKTCFFTAESLLNVQLHIHSQIFQF